MDYLKNKAKKVLSDRKKGRNIDVFDSDVFITSYPKSGNTWLRFLLGNILFEDFNFANMEDLIPDIYVNNNSFLKNNSSRRILKSHEYFDPRYKKIIYIVRDPRSVFISYFEFLRKKKVLDINSSHDDFIDLFIKGDFVEYGNWGENIGSWIGAKRESEDFLLIKYEDLKTKTEEKLIDILNFMNKPVDSSKIKISIEKSSFNEMSRNEQKNKLKIKALKGSDKNMPFVRKGSVDEWKESLSVENTNKIIDNFGGLMSELGYIKN